MPFAFLLAALAEVPDPRRAQGQRYSMSHLLLFSVLAVLTGATSYKKIIAFIALQRERLNTVFGACFRRAPAVNTLRHLFLALGRDDLEAAFRRHARDLSAGDTASMSRTVAFASGADKWADPEHCPWTIGWNPSYRTEAQIYAKHMQQTAPGAKLAILYQNDDFGKDYLAGVHDALGPRFDQVMVKAVSYEVTDPTVNSQIVSLQASGADALFTAATPKFAVQTIKRVAELGWHPTPHYLSVNAASVGAVMIPTGAENGKGLISAIFIKDQTDPQWANDAGMQEWQAFMRQWMPEGDIKDTFATYGYGTALLLKRVLEQCGDDLSRENIMHQAANLNDLEIPVLLPGIKVNTSPSNFHPIRHMQLARWTGTAWKLFGQVLEGA